MAEKITTSLFEGGSGDKLTVADVYKTVKKPVNVAVKALQADVNSAVNAFKAIDVKDPAGTALSVFQKALPILDADTKKGREDRLKSLLGGSLSVLNSADSTLKGMIADSMDVMSKGEGALAKISGVVKAYTTGELADVKGLAGVVNSLTGATTFAGIDIGAHGAMMLGGTAMAIEMGLGDVVMNEIVGSMDTGDEKIDRENRIRVLSPNLKTAAQWGDVKSLAFIMDTIGEGTAAAQVPTLPMEILNGYRIPVGKTTDDFEDLLEELVGVLDRLDPEWATQKRNGVTVPFLEPFTFASQDAKRLFMVSDEYRAQAMIASSYLSVDAGTNLKAKYPKMVVTV